VDTPKQREKEKATSGENGGCNGVAWNRTADSPIHRKLFSSENKKKNFDLPKPGSETGGMMKKDTRFNWGARGFIRQKNEKDQGLDKKVWEGDETLSLQLRGGGQARNKDRMNFRPCSYRLTIRKKGGKWKKKT